MLYIIFLGASIAFFHQWLRGDGWLFLGLAAACLAAAPARYAARNKRRLRRAEKLLRAMAKSGGKKSAPPVLRLVGRDVWRKARDIEVLIVLAMVIAFLLTGRFFYFDIKI